MGRPLVVVNLNGAAVRLLPSLLALRVLKEEARNPRCEADFFDERVLVDGDEKTVCWVPMMVARRFTGHAGTARGGRRVGRCGC